jgi:hypothetical protein
MTFGPLLGALLAASLTAMPVFAQSKSVPRDQLAVDVVSLKTGRSLRGAVLYRSPKGDLSIAVTRAWLKQANAGYYEQVVAADRQSQQDAWTQTRDRLKVLLETPPEQARLAFFYRSELDRLEELLAKKEPPETEFLVLELTAAAVGKVTLGSPERRRLALLAWQEELPDVEARDASSLKQMLLKEGVPLEGPLPDLSDRLPAQPQSEREWAARLALVEYALSHPLDFQGMGSTVVQTGADQSVDLATVLPKLLQEQVGSVLDDLLGNAKPGIKPQDDGELLKPAIAVAEKAGSRGFRITRLQLNAETSRVVVETRFMARLTPGDWQPVWATVEQADGKQARPAQEEQIEADPQLQTALKSIKALGLGLEDGLRQAIRVGAATMAAQQTADERFFEIRDRYTRRLDGPRLPVGN